MSADTLPVVATRATPGVGPVPAVGPLPPVRLPKVAERTLANGLRVLAVRRPGVPMVELRLRVPFAGKSPAHSARSEVLAATLFAGTPDRDRASYAAALQSLGADFSAGVDADRLLIIGSGLAGGMPALLGLLGEALRGATHPKREVAVERDRLGQELQIARSQPGVIAREALLRRMYGEHPYGTDLPPAEAVAEVRGGQVRTLHARRVVPAGSLLVLVGDVTPTAALSAAERALDSWAGEGGAAQVPPAPVPGPAPLLLVDRPGAVQSTVRLAGPALARTDPSYAALALANLVFGGYFSSRLVANIRERRGYTYSPHSGVEHPVGGSRLTVGADVSTNVTAPALMEMRYELGRIATVAVDADELAAAQRYATGVLALGTATQAGLASSLTGLVAAGLGVEWLRDHPKALAAVTVDEVLAAAQRYLAPATMTTVVVGDVSVVRTGLTALDAVEVA